MRAPVALVLVSSLALTAVLAAQDPGQQRPPTFRSSTRLVQVSVVVQDGRNQAVHGLKAEDFELLENGKPMPLAFFSFRNESQGTTAVTHAALAAQGRFTNRIQSPTGGGVVAIVFDQLNTAFQDQAYGRQQLIRYLRTIRPDDRVALFALTPRGMRILYDFTRDSESLVRALESLNRGESLAATGDRALPADMVEGLSAFAEGALDRVEQHFVYLRTTTTIEGLRIVADYLAGVPGRKNLVWISSGFPVVLTEGGASGMTFSSFKTPARGAARALNGSDTAVYPVDARGLVAQSSNPNAPGLVPTLAEVVAPLDGVRQVADWTGGRAFFNTNDIGTAITRAVEDSRQTYILGYYPPDTQWDGRFRTLQVKVRRPGVQVRHREGYFALPPVAAGAGRASIASAVISPLEQTAIPIDVTATSQPGGYQLRITIDPRAIALKSDDRGWSGQLEIAVAQLLDNREFMREPDRSVPLSGDEQARQAWMRDGVQVTHTLDLRPNTRQIRIVVRDGVSGAVGSLFIEADRLRRGPRESRTVTVQRPQ